MISAIAIAIITAVLALFGWRKSVIAKADDKVKAADVAATVKVATVEKAAEKETETIKGANDVQNEVAKLDSAAVADQLRSDWTRD